MPALMYIKYYQGGVRTGTLQKVGSKQKTHTYWADKSKTLVANAHPETQGDRKQRPSPRTPVRSHVKEGSSEGVGSPGRGKGQHGYLRERRGSISVPPQVQRVQNPGKGKASEEFYLFVLFLFFLFFLPTLFFFLFSDIFLK